MSKELLVFEREGECCVVVVTQQSLKKRHYHGCTKKDVLDVSHFDSEALSSV